ncbi:MAG: glycosyltransferase family 4 protein [Butyrivibrio sp.]|nr:glycosyltransferase family 4 protein [Butyrivibrio sp.]
MMSKYFLTYEPLKLFGIDLETVQNVRGFPIDSAYVYLIFRLGIVAYIIYLLAVSLLIYQQIKKDRRADLAVTLALTAGGMIETYLFNQSYKNLIFIFLGNFLFEKTANLKKLGKLPQIVTEEKFGFTCGEKKCPIIFRKNSEKGKTPFNILAFAGFIFILVGIIVSLLYFIIFPVPRNIYLPDYEYTKGDAEEVYLTESQVKELKKNGDIIRGYIDENTPLYRMKRRSVAKVEYIRYIFSYGLWAGSIVCIVFLLVWTTKSKVRFLLRNRKIGSGYKENVLIVHNYYRIPGGEDVVVANEKKLLESHGHKVILYTRNNDEVKDKGLLNKVGLLFVSIFNIRTYNDICKIIDKEKIDIIQVHNTVALISPAVYLAGINRGVPVIQTVHNFRLVCPNGVCYVNGHVCEECLEHGLKVSLSHNCYRNSKIQTFVCALTIKIQRVLFTYRAINYICLTEFNKKKLLSEKQILEQKIYVKPNFTSIDNKIVPYELRKKQIVYAGRLEKIKGIDLLVQAWMKLGDSAPKLVICGCGELEEWCKEYINNNELKNIALIGQVSNSEVKKIIGESIAMIHPTQWYEGFPMTIAEAYTLGTPIIASDIGNVGDLVIDGVTGVKFKSNSVVALANAVERFMVNPIKLPDEYLTKYTAENNYTMLKNIFEDVRKKL